MPKLISTTSPLKPIIVWDITTGEQEHNWAVPVTELINWVTAETKRNYLAHSVTLLKELNATNRTGSANSWGRQHGYTSDYKTLPASVKAKSRLNELVLHKLVSETFAYTQNLNPRKQPPSFAPKINLGAVDKQMVSLSIEGDTLYLSWKSWDKELLFEFQLPAYLLDKRTVSKFSLPTVMLVNGSPVFHFAYEEQITFNKTNKLVAGIDLGRVEPYTIAVLNSENARVAHYTSSGRLKALNKQRENILVHKSNILTKIDAYTALDNSVLAGKHLVLRTEANRLAGKARVLGDQVALQQAAEIARKLEKHKLTMLNMENLKWAVGNKYGSRWNHSKQQEAITHSLARVGTRTVRVNPKNTSQECHKCGTKLVHSTKSRSVWCGECKTSLDRDFNAAMNIAKINNRHLNKNSMIEGNHSSTEQVTGLAPDSVKVKESYTSCITFPT